MKERKVLEIVLCHPALNQTLKLDKILNTGVS